MSKFWFFERKGRPTHNEKRICDNFNSVINEGKISAKEVEQYIEEYGKPMNETELDEMFGYLTGEYSNGKKYQYADSEYDDSDDSDDVEYEESESDEYQDNNFNSNSNSDAKDPIDFNPFEEPVIERSYTRGFAPKNENFDDESDSEDDDSETNVNFTNDDLKMPTDGVEIDDEEDEDIPEPEWASTGGFTTALEEEDEDEDEYDEEDDDREKLGGDNLQDLTPAQKRKAAEKTADALLNMYCQFAPLPFKKWASFKDNKIQRLVFENKIDLSMQLENNISVKDYIDGHNEQVEEIFKVSDETREEIKDPLVDVLLEQDLALTPTQRLLLAVGGHVVTMGFSAFQLSQNNKQALEAFEKFHIQMNQQKAPVYQEQEPNITRERRNRPVQDKITKEELENVRKWTDPNYDPDDDEIIDAEHDPSVTVTEDYDDED